MTCVKRKVKATVNGTQLNSNWSAITCKDVLQASAVSFLDFAKFLNYFDPSYSYSCPRRPISRAPLDRLSTLPSAEHFLSLPTTTRLRQLPVAPGISSPSLYFNSREASDFKYSIPSSPVAGLTNLARSDSQPSSSS